MNAAGLSLRHKHVIVFIETLKPNWFFIRKLTPTNEAHRVLSVTGGQEAGHHHQAVITSLLAAPHYESHCKKTRQEVLSSGSPSHCIRRGQQAGRGCLSKI